MYKYLLIPALCCLIISSCVTTQNTTHAWDQLGEKKKKQFPTQKRTNLT